MCILLNFEVVHDCWYVDVTEKCRDGFLREDALMQLDKNISCLTYIKSSDVNKYIKQIKKHPLVIRSDKIYKNKNSAQIRVLQKLYPTVTKNIWDSNCVILKPEISKDGVDKFSILAPSNRNIKSFLRKCEDGFDIRIKSKKTLNDDDIKPLDIFRTSGFFELLDAKKDLSIKQKEVLNIACKLGYYTYPKNLTISDIADKLGIAESTTRHHLRTAESKVVPIFSKVMKAI